VTDSPMHEAVEAVRERDRRIRRGFVALALLVVLALAASTVVQILAVGAVRDQTDVLRRRQRTEVELLDELAQEGEARTVLIRLLRSRFRRADHRTVKGHNLIIQALEDLATLAGIDADLGRVRQRNGDGGGGAGGSGDTGGSTPPPPPPTVGQSSKCPPRNPHCRPSP
jgi:hypothetical protein